MLKGTSVVAGKVLSALGVIRMVVALGVAECVITKNGNQMFMPVALGLQCD